LNLQWARFSGADTARFLSTPFGWQLYQFAYYCVFGFIYSFARVKALGNRFHQATPASGTDV